MAALMARVRPLTHKPLIVKLTPNVSDVVPVALAAEEGGADALSLINTLRATAIDPRTGSAVARCGAGRAVRSGGATGRACAHVAGCRAHAASDRRHGRHPVGARRARLPARRRDVRRRRHGELPRSRRGRARARRAGAAAAGTRRWTRRCMRPPPHARVCAPPDAPRSRHRTISFGARFVGRFRPRAPSRLFATVFFGVGGCTPRSRAYNRRPCPPRRSLPPQPPSARWPRGWRRSTRRIASGPSGRS